MTVRPFRSMTSVPAPAKLEHLAAVANGEDTAHFERDSLEGAVIGVGCNHTAVGENKIGREAECILSGRLLPLKDTATAPS